MRLFLLSIVVLLAACGGGGGSSDGTVIQGTLIERGTGHTDFSNQSLKHSAGEALEDVKVCILTECSITDGRGQWGLNINNFPGGDISVKVEGHGISTSASVSLPASAQEVEITLGHNNTTNVVSVEKLLIDGEDHSGHDHSHS